MLFEERIRMIFKKLQPAFIGKVNYTDENLFEDFAVEANRNIDQVCSIAKSEDYIEIILIIVDQYDYIIQRELYQMLYEMCED